MRDRRAQRHFDATHSQVASVVEHDLEPLKAAVLRLHGRLPPVE